jgi:hypothetical protein
MTLSIDISDDLLLIKKSGILAIKSQKYLSLSKKELVLSNKIRSDVIIFFKYSFIFQ